MGSHNPDNNSKLGDCKPKTSSDLGGEVSFFTTNCNPDYDSESDSGSIGNFPFSEWDEPGWETESENSDFGLDSLIDTDTHALFVAGHTYAPAVQPAAASVPAQPVPQPDHQPQPPPGPAQHQGGGRALPGGWISRVALGLMFIISVMGNAAGHLPTDTNNTLVLGWDCSRPTLLDVFERSLFCHMGQPTPKPGHPNTPMPSPKLCGSLTSRAGTAAL